MKRFVARHVASLPKSGIRDFFEIVSKMKDVISLGIGEPDFDTPWHIREATPDDKCDLVVEWRIVDAKWYEIFAKAGLKSAFKIFLKFDEAKKEVRGVDQEWTVEWRAGVPAMSISATAFRGQKAEISFGQAYGFTEKLSVGQIYNYYFKTSEMKTPMQDTITGDGWTYRAVAFGKL